MASYKPIRNPLLGADPMDLMPSPVAAARVPGRFLVRKLAATMKKQEAIYKNFLGETRQIEQFYEQAKKTPAAIPEFMPPKLESLGSTGERIEIATNALLQETEERALVKARRAQAALNLWRLRNLPIGETIRRAIPGKPDLYKWYRQALEHGPWQP